MLRGPEADLREEMIDEPPPALRPAGQDREVAVGADRGAEGDVEIEAGVIRGGNFKILPFRQPEPRPQLRKNLLGGNQLGHTFVNLLAPAIDLLQPELFVPTL